MMGCNSHLAIEYNPWLKGSWRPYAIDLAEERDYRLYTAIAGVRNYWENNAEINKFVLPVKGLPTDLSDEVKKFVENYGSDGHNHTWLSAREYDMAMLASRLFLEETYINKPAEVIRVILNALERLYGEDKVRLIIFFDN